MHGVEAPEDSEVGEIMRQSDETYWIMCVYESFTSTNL